MNRFVTRSLLLFAGLMLILMGAATPSGEPFYRSNARERRSLGEAFEPRWNRWNSIRTAFASSSVPLVMILLLRL
jgi:hypothetical protein